MCYLQCQLGVAFLMDKEFTRMEEKLQKVLELTRKIPIEQYLTSSIHFQVLSSELDSVLFLKDHIFENPIDDI